MYFSYSSRNRAMAEELAIRLREADLSPFFDRWCLPGGKPWGAVPGTVYPGKRHRFILGETWLYNLLLPDHGPAASKTFWSAGLLSSASKSVKRSRYALKRCQESGSCAVLVEALIC
jgi:hypothetical protein